MTTGLEVAIAADKPGAAVPEVIVVREDASPLESLAAQEIRRYAYLRTGKLLPVRRAAEGVDHIQVTCQEQAKSGSAGQALAAQQFALRSGAEAGRHVWRVVGGDEVGTLYGAYRFAELLGVGFGIDQDLLPDEPLTVWPETNETGSPRFRLRGLQPFHDFSVGPDWWNLADYRSVLAQMAKLRMNFIGLHTYPSWNPSAGPEANVWIGLPEDVEENGDVRTAYEAGVVTTRRGWEVKPFPTGEYASGAGLLFEADDYGPDYMVDCLEWPKSPEAAVAMFNRYGDFQRQVFSHARRLGIKTCVGTETPLGVPKELAARLAAKGLKSDDPAVIRRLYEGTFLRVQRKLSPDYYWIWAPEVWLGMEPGCGGWEITSREKTERDLAAAVAAVAETRPSFGMATGGWRLGTRDDPLWMDRRTPKTWAASSINTSLGGDPVEKAYGTMKDRPRWVIGWAEDDGTAGAHCCTCWDLQLNAARIFAHSQQASDYGCEGMLAIHWRTTSIAPNLTALAQAGWNRGDANKDAAATVTEANSFWADWGRHQFGGDSGAEAGRLIGKFDGQHGAINRLVQGGAGTGDEAIAGIFAPLAALDALRPAIRGTANQERFDDWRNQVTATRLRVRTWVLAARLGKAVEEAKRIAEADKRKAFVRTGVLPLRLELARSYEDLIGAFVSCAKSPGEVGTIASIESGNRNRIVCAHDGATEDLLGGRLPAEAAIRTAYRGAPRIFVSARNTQINAGEAEEIRAFVLAESRCQAVSLSWRPLGQGEYRKINAIHRGRNAYRVELPPQASGAVEYFLEAVLDGGQQVHWPVTAPGVGQTAVVW